MDDDICGATFIGTTGIEWICILPPHDFGYRHSEFDRLPEDKHYYVNRWPYRPIKKEE